MWFEPGEQARAGDEPLLGYLTALEACDKKFSGFEHDIHGVDRTPSGDFLIECLTGKQT